MGGAGPFPSVVRLHFSPREHGTQERFTVGPPGTAARRLLRARMLGGEGGGPGHGTSTVLLHGCYMTMARTYVTAWLASPSSSPASHE